MGMQSITENHTRFLCIIEYTVTSAELDQLIRQFF